MSDRSLPVLGVLLVCIFLLPRPLPGGEAGPFKASRTEPLPYAEGVRNLAAELLRRIPQDVGAAHSRIAVGPFVCDGTNFTGKLGERLSIDLLDKLARAKTLAVVSRNDFISLMDEKDFWLSDIAASVVVPKAPEGFAAFTLLVRGGYSADAPALALHVQAQIVDVRAGRVVGATEMTIDCSSLPLPFDAREVQEARAIASDLAQTNAAVTEGVRGLPPDTPAAPPVRVRVWAAGGEKMFREHEKLRFRITTDRDAYVRLFSIRSGRSPVMIFPNAYHSDNFLRAGESLTVPSSRMEFDFVVGPPFGPEAVQAVATTSRVVSNYIATRGLDPPANESDPFTRIPGGAEGLAEIIRETRTRGVMVAPSKQADSAPAWAEDHWTFVTVPAASDVRVRGILTEETFTPTVGVEPFVPKADWNKTRLKDLDVAERLTREVRRKLLAGAATPVILPADVLRRWGDADAELRSLLTKEQLRGLRRLHYGVTGSADLLEATSDEAALTVTYEIYQRTARRETDALSRVLKHTVKTTARHDDTDLSLRSAVQRLIEETASQITGHVCPTIMKHAQAALRG